MDSKSFQKIVLDYYHTHRRDLPWRQPQTNAYKILLSEIMLQQTQVERVKKYYQAFLEKYPTVQSLANAPLEDILKLWQGLGYNRRARYLKQAAEILQVQPEPWSAELLKSCPGVGPNTAAAVVVYSYNQPVVFIETNIRSVYLHHFFSNQKDITDAQLMPLIVKTQDQHNPRVWYWALMDYGSHLKASIPNPSRQSRHHVRQTTFEGSVRQLRSQILREILAGEKSAGSLRRKFATDQRFETALKGLLADGLIVLKNNRYHIAK